MMQKACLFSIILFSFAFTHSRSQTHSITGYVTDSDGNPIKGATIWSLKRKHGVSESNASGFYSLVENYEGDTLVCSHINYTDKSEKISGNNFVGFILSKRVIFPRNIEISIERRNKIVARKVAYDSVDHNSDLHSGDYFTKVEVPSLLPPVLLKKLTDSIQSRALMLQQIDSLKRIYGEVKVRVKINTEGLIIEKLLLKGIHIAYNEMVLQTLDELKLRWVPTEQNGRKVESYQELAVNL